MSAQLVGERVGRSEDRRLLTGRAVFTDDIEPHAAHAAFVRSEHAHARIVDIDVEGALDVDGVLGIFTHEDLEGVFGQRLPQLREHPGLTASQTPYLLVAEEAHFAGSPIAMVVARDRYVAEDAAGRIRVDYEPLDVVVDLAAAAEGATGVAHSQMSDNVAGEVRQQRGDVDAAFARAAHVVEGTYTLDRAAAHPLEARAVVARYDPQLGRLQVHDTTQAPLIIRDGLAAMFGLDVDDVEVIAPSVGGSFGVKGFQFYPEEVLVPWAARRLGAPVKWTEDRREHFTGSNHSRKQIHDVRIAFDDQGRILGYDVDFVHDSGAYCQYGMTTPLITAAHLMGPYKMGSLRYRMRTVLTNTTPTSPYRGSGVPYAVFALERLLDRAAGELGIDRVELRRRNLLTPADFPYDVGVTFATGRPTVYDSGDYAPGLELLLEAIDRPRFEEEKAAAAAEGRRLGLGLACYVEASGAGPYEGAKVDVLADGSITLATGAAPAGQGHETMLAQVVADELGVPMDSVRVTTGDSRRIAHGRGTYGSRTAVIVGNAALQAGREVRRKLVALAAHLLEAAPEDIELAAGFAGVRGVPAARIPIGQLARASQAIPPAVRGEQSPGVGASAYVSPPQTIFGSGMHAAVVEIDPDTFGLRILRYAAVHDCGKVINPSIVEGQVRGAVAQGIGGAFYEQLVYDEAGQLQNASFMDFLMPYATEIPPLTLRHTQTPSPTNELGLKGAGETGVVPVAAVIASAVEDATGHHVTESPLSPQRLFEIAARTPPPARVPTPG